MIWEFRYDGKVLEAIRSGTATIPAIRRDLDVPPGTLKKVLSRLLAAGKVRKITKDWYTACE